MFRQLGEGDIEAVVALFATIEDDPYFQPTPPLSAREARRICMYEGRDYYVGLFEDRLVGYGALKGWDEGFEIPSLTIALHPDYRGQGRGRALMQHLHDYARLAGATKMRLRVYPDNAVGIRLFESLGYVTDHEEAGLLIQFKDLDDGTPVPVQQGFGNELVAPPPLDRAATKGVVDAPLPYHRSAYVYDALYASKDYHAECDYIEQQIGRFAHRPVHEILDVACGTGVHATLLAERGYRMHGVDLSPVMVSMARVRAYEAGQQIDFRQGDMRELSLGRTFDALTIMFASFGSVTEEHDVRRSLEAARQHLRPGGLLLLDVWQWIPSYFSRSSLRAVTVDGLQVRREGVISIDDQRHIASLHHHFAIEGREEWDESFDVRAYTPDELRSLCTEAGLVVEEICAAYTPGSDPAGAPSIALVARRPD